MQCNAMQFSQSIIFVQPPSSWAYKVQNQNKRTNSTNLHARCIQISALCLLDQPLSAFTSMSIQRCLFVLFTVPEAATISLAGSRNHFWPKKYANHESKLGAAAAMELGGSSNSSADLPPTQVLRANQLDSASRDALCELENRQAKVVGDSAESYRVSNMSPAQTQMRRGKRAPTCHLGMKTDFHEQQRPICGQCQKSHRDCQRSERKSRCRKSCWI